ncbi:MAG: hypothetical protein KDN18_15030 [Verrucomicrobiae bacterium]|nr:hypothetical protein [Verrucomicrobiae bacterium]
MKSVSLCFCLLLAGLPVSFTGCKSKNPEQPVAQVPVPPAQYGMPGQPGDPNAPIPGVPGAPGAPVPADQAGGRFGYGGGAAPAPGAPAPAPAPGLRDVRDMGSSGNVKPPAEEKPTPPPAPSTPSSSEMPYATPVPGNPLVVTLPGTHASLGQISIEKYDSGGNPTGEPLKRGTQVQIPDPNNPGKKIYFKVP